jgi:glycine cleavage system H lipoate-binding protein
MDVKEQGLKVIPVGERKCIWMDAGVVSFKLCTNQYQCNTCEYDLAMSNRARKDKISAKEHKPASHKKEIAVWMEEFRYLPADQRKCRYMLNGEVSHKICPNSFRCGECSFDQMMQDRIQPAFERDIQAFDRAAGFYMHKSLYYFRNHTWLQLERNGRYRVGIDDFARRIIGSVNSIELPPVGKDLDLEEYAWTIHHDYGDLEFFSPVKGVVESINQELIEDASLITEQSYAGGWLMTVEPQSITRSNKNFLKGNEARAWMVEEANLLKQTIGSEAGVTGTLHDGAAITTDMSINLSEQKWNEIVKKHLYTR